jgi:hypothetical protein
MELILGNEANGIFTRDGMLFFYEEYMEKYHFYEHDFTNKKEISLEKYFSFRFGPANMKVIEQYGLLNSLNLLSETLKDGTLITHFYQDSFFYKFNQQGEILWKTDLIGSFDTVYSIAIEGNSIWCAFPTNHTIKRYSLKTFKEEITIGDKEPWSYSAEIFNHPEDLFISGDLLYVADMGNERICKVDLKTFNIQEYKKLDEPVWSYMVVNNNELVLLDSGLYYIHQ